MPCAAAPRAWTIRLGNPLVVEMRDFFAQYKIFEKRRAPLARF